MFGRYYTALGIPDTAEKAQIKSAFRRLAAIYHPDKNPAHAQRFMDICEAYDVLMGKTAPFKVTPANGNCSFNGQDCRRKDTFQRHGSPSNRRFETVLESHYKGRHIKTHA